MLLVELHKLIANVEPALLGVVPQCCQISSGKMMVGVFRVRQRLEKLLHPPRIALEVLLVLRVHGFELSVECGFKEKGGDEELCEAVESAIERGCEVAVGRGSVNG